MEDKKDKLIGLVGTVAFHLLLILLLVFFGLPSIEKPDGEGILVMVGVVDGDDVGTASRPEPELETPVEPEPETAVPEPPAPSVSTPAKQEVVTQDVEQSAYIAEAKKKAEAEAKKKADAEAKKKAEAEAKKKAEEEAKRKAEEEKRKQAEAISKRTGNAFANNNTTQTGTSGTGSSGTSNAGNPFGNSTTGAASGSPGYGSYDLGGRGIRGTLPRPSYSVNESGKVVVDITVDEEGNVTNVAVGKGTTTTSTVLRQSALAAAKRAKFDVKKGSISQSGTITYRFDSDN
jgi:TonB family protein